MSLCTSVGKGCERETRFLTTTQPRTTERSNARLCWAKAPLFDGRVGLSFSSTQSRPQCSSALHSVRVCASFSLRISLSSNDTQTTRQASAHNGPAEKTHLQWRHQVREPRLTRESVCATNSRRQKDTNWPIAGFSIAKLQLPELSLDTVNTLWCNADQNTQESRFTN